LIREHDGDWDFIDEICQMANIPFVPKEWENIAEMNPHGAFYKYAQIFLNSEYDGIAWKDYFDAFRALRDAEEILNDIVNKFRHLKHKERQMILKAMLVHKPTKEFVEDIHDGSHT
jgi:hypothetical protein